MQGQGSGSIINISSTYGHEGAAGASVYAGSKHAVEGITRSVAREIAKSGIRVNGVAPRPLGGACQRDRLHRVGRSFLHHRPRPQRRWRQDRWLILRKEWTL